MQNDHAIKAQLIINNCFFVKYIIKKEISTTVWSILFHEYKNFKEEVINDNCSLSLQHATYLYISFLLHSRVKNDVSCQWLVAYLIAVLFLSFDSSLPCLAISGCSYSEKAEVGNFCCKVESLSS